MPQTTIDIRKKEPPLQPLQPVWWKPLFSLQKDAAEVYKDACTGFTPANKFWDAQTRMLERTHNRMHRLFGEIFNTRQRAMPWLTGNNTEPNMNITENGKIFTLTAELPGVEEKDMKISLTDGGFVIQGEKKIEHSEQNEATLHRECIFGSFSRTVALPEEADLEKAEAAFDKHILSISIPKKR